MITSVADAVHRLLEPEQFVRRHEAILRSSPVPSVSGVYAWYFDEPPTGVPVHNSHVREGWSLLYAGISPRRPRSSDGKASKGAIRSRIRNHYRSDASRSTLRLSLGSLLHRELGIQLQFSESLRRTFGDGESRLSDWMAAHTKVCWVEHAEPWLVEEALIAAVPLRLNLDKNSNGDFHRELTEARAQQRRFR